MHKAPREQVWEQFFLYLLYGRKNRRGCRLFWPQEINLVLYRVSWDLSLFFFLHITLCLQSYTYIFPLRYPPFSLVEPKGHNSSSVAERQTNIWSPLINIHLLLSFRPERALFRITSLQLKEQLTEMLTVTKAALIAGECKQLKTSMPLNY